MYFLVTGIEHSVNMIQTFAALKITEAYRQPPFVAQRVGAHSKTLSTRTTPTIRKIFHADVRVARIAIGFQSFTFGQPTCSLVLFGPSCWNL